MAKRKDTINIKARLNLKLDRDMKDWVMLYANRHGTTVSNLIRDYFVQLRKDAESRTEIVEQI